MLDNDNLRKYKIKFYNNFTDQRKPTTIKKNKLKKKNNQTQKNAQKANNSPNLPVEENNAL